MNVYKGPVNFFNVHDFHSEVMSPYQFKVLVLVFLTSHTMLLQSSNKLKPIFILINMNHNWNIFLNGESYFWYVRIIEWQI